jgi:glycosyltransferase involved in cell wall biosynthesis
MTDISVLLPVATGVDIAGLRRAHRSVVDQTLEPEEVLLVTNQSLPTPLQETISELIDSHASTRHEHFPNTRGLGGVLQAGLEDCLAPYIARMDADDVADPDRFAEQIDVLINSETDVVGGQLAEFRNDPEHPDRIRRVPLTHADIADWMAWRCPINHPTVTFDREAVLDAGGYRHAPMMEDWDLWARCLASGLRFQNLDRTLVRARVTDLTDRRGGVAYARAELRMARELRHLGIASTTDTVRHLCLRVPTRLLPASIRERVYQIFAR